MTWSSILSNLWSAFWDHPLEKRMAIRRSSSRYTTNTHSHDTFYEQVSSYLELGDQHLNQGQYSEALRNFNIVIDFDPVSWIEQQFAGTELVPGSTDSMVVDWLSHKAVAYSRRAFIHELRSQYDKSMSDINSAIALNPQYEDLYKQRGELWSKLKVYDRAIADFDTAIRLSPQVEAFRARADVYTELGNYERALNDCEMVLNLSPDSNAYAARGKAYFKLKEYGKALKDLSIAIILDEANSTAYSTRGAVHVKQGNHHKAIDDFTQYIGLLPHIVDKHRDLFDKLEGEAALAMYDLFVDDLALTHVYRGFSFLELRDSQKAIDDFTYAIKLKSESADFYCARASGYVQLDRHSEAMADLETALSLDSTSTNALFVRAASHLKNDELQAAIENSSKAIELEPIHRDAYCIRGRAYLYLGDYQNTIIDLDKSIELEGEKEAFFHTDRRDAYAFRGLAYLMLANFTAAKNDLYRALELGFSPVEIEREILEITSKVENQGAIISFVKGVLSSRQIPDTPHTKCTSPRESGQLSAKTRGGLTKQEYIDLFASLGFHDIEIGKTLKHRMGIPSIYFNSRYGFVSFVVYVKDKGRYEPELWDEIPSQKNKDNKSILMTLVPKGGREREAFEELLT